MFFNFKFNKMNKRKDLVNDILKFLSEANISFENYGFINKKVYLSFETKYSNLTKEDFDCEEKYFNFLRYLNHIQFQADRYVLKNLLKDNHLDIGPFLFMYNDLNRIADCLK